MKIDPAASFWPWAITVSHGEHEWTIPPLPAADWLLAYASDTWAGIIPGMLGDQDREELDDLILNGLIGEADCNAMAQDAFGLAAGMRWWSAVRLAHVATSQWHTVGGELLRWGVDPAQRPLGAVLTAVYRILVHGSDEQRRIRLDMDLDRPPPGTDADDLFDPADAERAFMAIGEAGG